MLGKLFGKKNRFEPTAGEKLEAKNNLGGYVYRIDGRYDPNGEIPPYAIIGAWTVNADGNITGDFQNNPNFDEGKIKNCPLKKDNGPLGKSN